MPNHTGNLVRELLTRYQTITVLTSSVLTLPLALCKYEEKKIEPLVTLWPGMWPGCITPIQHAT